MSKDASLDLYLNRGLLFVGSTGDPWDEQELFAKPRDGERTVALSSDSHVMIRVRAQVALVRVEIWHRRCPIVGDVVFDGTLNLPDGILTVSEFDKLTSAQKKVGAGGDHRITIRVDDQGEASRVMVIRDCAADERPLTSARGHDLPAVTSAADEVLSPIDELGLILSTHDLPLARLAASIKILLIHNDLSKYAVTMIVEWLRWVHPMARAADCKALGDRLSAALAGSSDLDVDDRALTLARDILTALGVTAV